MPDSVGSQIIRPMSIPKKKLGNSLNKSGRAPQQENNNIRAKTPTQKGIS